ncbi:hypothetical protein DFJ73DRAFT_770965, partial [Zopfochytrium polystomum]
RPQGVNLCEKNRLCQAPAIGKKRTGWWSTTGTLLSARPYTWKSTGSRPISEVQAQDGTLLHFFTVIPAFVLVGFRVEGGALFAAVCSKLPFGCGVVWLWCCQPQRSLSSHGSHGPPDNICANPEPQEKKTCWDWLWDAVVITGQLRPYAWQSTGSRPISEVNSKTAWVVANLQLDQAGSRQTLGTLGGKTFLALCFIQRHKGVNLAPAIGKEQGVVDNGTLLSATAIHLEKYRIPSDLRSQAQDGTLLHFFTVIPAFVLVGFRVEGGALFAAVAASCLLAVVWCGCGAVNPKGPSPLTDPTGHRITFVQILNPKKKRHPSFALLCLGIKGWDWLWDAVVITGQLRPYAWQSTGSRPISEVNSKTAWVVANLQLDQAGSRQTLGTLGGKTFLALCFIQRHKGVNLAPAIGKEQGVVDNGTLLSATAIHLEKYRIPSDLRSQAQDGTLLHFFTVIPAFVLVGFRVEGGALFAAVAASCLLAVVWCGCGAVNPKGPSPLTDPTGHRITFVQILNPKKKRHPSFALLCLGIKGWDWLWDAVVITGQLRPYAWQSTGSRPISEVNSKTAWVVANLQLDQAGSRQTLGTLGGKTFLALCFIQRHKGVNLAPAIGKEQGVVDNGTLLSATAIHLEKYRIPSDLRSQAQDGTLLHFFTVIPAFVLVGFRVEGGALFAAVAASCLLAVVWCGCGAVNPKGPSPLTDPTGHRITFVQILNPKKKRHPSFALLCLGIKGWDWLWDAVVITGQLRPYAWQSTGSRPISEVNSKTAWVVANLQLDQAGSRQTLGTLGGKTFLALCFIQRHKGVNLAPAIGKEQGVVDNGTLLSATAIHLEKYRIPSDLRSQAQDGTLLHFFTVIPAFVLVGFRVEGGALFAAVAASCLLAVVWCGCGAVNPKGPSPLTDPTGHRITFVQILNPKKKRHPSFALLCLGIKGWDWLWDAVVITGQLRPYAWQSTGSRPISEVNSKTAWVVANLQLDQAGSRQTLGTLGGKTFLALCFIQRHKGVNLAPAIGKEQGVVDNGTLLSATAIHLEKYRIPSDLRSQAQDGTLLHFFTVIPAFVLVGFRVEGGRSLLRLQQAAFWLWSLSSHGSHGPPDNICANPEPQEKKTCWDWLWDAVVITGQLRPYAWQSTGSRPISEVNSKTAWVVANLQLDQAGSRQTLGTLGGKTFLALCFIQRHKGVNLAPAIGKEQGVVDNGTLLSATAIHLEKYRIPSDLRSQAQDGTLLHFFTVIPAFVLVGFRVEGGALFAAVAASCLLAVVWCGCGAVNPKGPSPLTDPTGHRITFVQILNPKKKRHPSFALLCLGIKGWDWLWDAVVITGQLRPYAWQSTGSRPISEVNSKTAWVVANLQLDQAGSRQTLGTLGGKTFLALCFIQRHKGVNLAPAIGKEQGVVDNGTLLSATAIHLEKYRIPSDLRSQAQDGTLLHFFTVIPAFVLVGFRVEGGRSLLRLQQAAFWLWSLSSHGSHGPPDNICANPEPQEKKTCWDWLWDAVVITGQLRPYAWQSTGSRPISEVNSKTAWVVANLQLDQAGSRQTLGTLGGKTFLALCFIQRHKGVNLAPAIGKEQGVVDNGTLLSATAIHLEKYRIPSDLRSQAQDGTLLHFFTVIPAFVLVGFRVEGGRSLLRLQQAAFWLWSLSSHGSHGPPDNICANPEPQEKKTCWDWLWDAVVITGQLRPYAWQSTGSRPISEVNSKTAWVVANLQLDQAGSRQTLGTLGGKTFLALCFIQRHKGVNLAPAIGKEQGVVDNGTLLSATAIHLEKYRIPSDLRSQAQDGTLLHFFTVIPAFVLVGFRVEGGRSLLRLQQAAFWLWSLSSHGSHGPPDNICANPEPQEKKTCWDWLWDAVVITGQLRPYAWQSTGSRPISEVNSKTAWVVANLQLDQAGSRQTLGTLGGKTFLALCFIQRHKGVNLAPAIGKEQGVVDNGTLLSATAIHLEKYRIPSDLRSQAQDGTLLHFFTVIPAFVLVGFRVEGGRSLLRLQQAAFWLWSLSSHGSHGPPDNICANPEPQEKKTCWDWLWDAVVITGQLRPYAWQSTGSRPISEVNSKTAWVVANLQLDQAGSRQTLGTLGGKTFLALCFIQRHKGVNLAPAIGKEQGVVDNGTLLSATAIHLEKYRIPSDLRSQAQDGTLLHFFTVIPAFVLVGFRVEGGRSLLRLQQAAFWLWSLSSHGSHGPPDNICANPEPQEKKTCWDWLWDAVVITGQLRPYAWQSTGSRPISEVNSKTAWVVANLQLDQAGSRQTLGTLGGKTFLALCFIQRHKGVNLAPAIGKEQGVVDNGTLLSATAIHLEKYRIPSDLRSQAQDGTLLHFFTVIPAFVLVGFRVEGGRSLLRLQQAAFWLWSLSSHGSHGPPDNICANPEPQEKKTCWDWLWDAVVITGQLRPYAWQSTGSRPISEVNSKTAWVVANLQLDQAGSRQTLGTLGGKTFLALCFIQRHKGVNLAPAIGKEQGVVDNGTLLSATAIHLEKYRIPSDLRSQAQDGTLLHFFTVIPAFVLVGFRVEGGRSLLRLQQAAFWLWSLSSHGSHGPPDNICANPEPQEKKTCWDWLWDAVVITGQLRPYAWQSTGSRPISEVNSKTAWVVANLQLDQAGSRQTLGTLGGKTFLALCFIQRHKGVNLAPAIGKEQGVVDNGTLLSATAIHLEKYRIPSDLRSQAQDGTLLHFFTVIPAFVLVGFRVEGGALFAAVAASCLLAVVWCGCGAVNPKGPSPLTDPTGHRITFVQILNPKKKRHPSFALLCLGIKGWDWLWDAVVITGQLRPYAWQSTGSRPISEVNSKTAWVVANLQLDQAGSRQTLGTLGGKTFLALCFIQRHKGVNLAPAIGKEQGVVDNGTLLSATAIHLEKYRIPSDLRSQAQDGTLLHFFTVIPAFVLVGFRVEGGRSLLRLQQAAFWLWSLSSHGSHGPPDNICANPEPQEKKTCWDWLWDAVVITGQLRPYAWQSTGSRPISEVNSKTAWVVANLQLDQAGSRQTLGTLGGKTFLALCFIQRHKGVNLAPAIGKEQGVVDNGTLLSATAIHLEKYRIPSDLRSQAQDGTLLHFFTVIPAFVLVGFRVEGGRSLLRLQQAAFWLWSLSSHGSHGPPDNICANPEPQEKKTCWDWLWDAVVITGQLRPYAWQSTGSRPISEVNSKTAWVVANLQLDQAGSRQTLGTLGGKTFLALCFIQRHKGVNLAPAIGKEQGVVDNGTLLSATAIHLEKYRIPSDLRSQAQDGTLLHFFTVIPAFVLVGFRVEGGRSLLRLQQAAFWLWSLSSHGSHGPPDNICANPEPQEKKTCWDWLWDAVVITGQLRPYAWQSTGSRPISEVNSKTAWVVANLQLDQAGSRQTLGTLGGKTFLALCFIQRHKGVNLAPAIGKEQGVVDNGTLLSATAIHLEKYRIPSDLRSQAQDGTLLHFFTVIPAFVLVGFRVEGGALFAAVAASCLLAVVWCGCGAVNPKGPSPLTDPTGHRITFVQILNPKKKRHPSFALLCLGIKGWDWLWDAVVITGQLRPYAWQSTGSRPISEVNSKTAWVVANLQLDQAGSRQTLGTLGGKTFLALCFIQRHKGVNLAPAIGKEQGVVDNGTLLSATAIHLEKYRIPSDLRSQAQDGTLLHFFTVIPAFVLVGFRVEGGRSLLRLQQAAFWLWSLSSHGSHGPPDNICANPEPQEKKTCWDWLWDAVVITGQLRPYAWQSTGSRPISEVNSKTAWVVANLQLDQAGSRQTLGTLGGKTFLALCFIQRHKGVNLAPAIGKEQGVVDNGTLLSATAIHLEKYRIPSDLRSQAQDGTLLHFFTVIPAFVLVGFRVEGGALFAAVAASCLLAVVWCGCGAVNPKGPSPLTDPTGHRITFVQILNPKKKRHPSFALLCLGIKGWDWLWDAVVITGQLRPYAWQSTGSRPISEVNSKTAWVVANLQLDQAGSRQTLGTLGGKTFLALCFIQRHKGVNLAPAIGKEQGVVDNGTLLSATAIHLEKYRIPSDLRSQAQDGTLLHFFTVIPAFVLVGFRVEGGALFAAVAASCLLAVVWCGCGAVNPKGPSPLTDPTGHRITFVQILNPKKKRHPSFALLCLGIKGWDWLWDAVVITGQLRPYAWQSTGSRPISEVNSKTAWVVANLQLDQAGSRQTLGTLGGKTFLALCFIQRHKGVNLAPAIGKEQGVVDNGTLLSATAIHLEKYRIPSDLRSQAQDGTLLHFFTVIPAFVLVGFRVEGGRSLLRLQQAAFWLWSLSSHGSHGPPDNICANPEPQEKKTCWDWLWDAVVITGQLRPYAWQSTGSRPISEVNSKTAWVVANLQLDQAGSRQTLGTLGGKTFLALCFIQRHKGVNLAPAIGKEQGVVDNGTLLSATAIHLEKYRIPSDLRSQAQDGTLLHFFTVIPAFVLVGFRVEGGRSLLRLQQAAFWLWSLSSHGSHGPPDNICANPEPQEKKTCWDWLWDAVVITGQLRPYAWQSTGSRPISEVNSKTAWVVANLQLDQAGSRQTLGTLGGKTFLALCFIQRHKGVNLAPAIGKEQGVVDNGTLLSATAIHLEKYRIPSDLRSQAQDGTLLHFFTVIPAFVLVGFRVEGGRSLLRLQQAAFWLWSLSSHGSHGPPDNICANPEPQEKKTCWDWLWDAVVITGQLRPYAWQSTGSRPISEVNSKTAWVVANLQLDQAGSRQTLGTLGGKTFLALCFIQRHKGVNLAPAIGKEQGVVDNGTLLSATAIHLEKYRIPSDLRSQAQDGTLLHFFTVIPAFVLVGFRVEGGALFAAVAASCLLAVVWCGCGAVNPKGPSPLTDPTGHRITFVQILNPKKKRHPSFALLCLGIKGWDWLWDAVVITGQLRPYAWQSTGSRPISEVNSKTAWVVANLQLDQAGSRQTLGTLGGKTFLALCFIQRHKGVNLAPAIGKEQGVVDNGTLLSATAIHLEKYRIPSDLRSQAQDGTLLHFFTVIPAFVLVGFRVEGGALFAAVAASCLLAVVWCGCGAVNPKGPSPLTDPTGHRITFVQILNPKKKRHPSFALLCLGIKGWDWLWDAVVITGQLRPYAWQSTGSRPISEVNSKTACWTRLAAGKPWEHWVENFFGLVFHTETQRGESGVRNRLCQAPAIGKEQGVVDNGTLLSATAIHLEKYRIPSDLRSQAQDGTVMIPAFVLVGFRVEGGRSLLRFAASCLLAVVWCGCGAVNPKGPSPLTDPTGHRITFVQILNPKKKRHLSSLASYGHTLGKVPDPVRSPKSTPRRHGVVANLQLDQAGSRQTLGTLGGKTFFGLVFHTETPKGCESGAPAIGKEQGVVDNGTLLSATAIHLEKYRIPSDLRSQAQDGT